MKQRRRRVNHVHHLVEAPGNFPVVMGCAVDGQHVTVNLVCAWRFGALYAGETKVLTHCQSPGILDGSRRALEEFARHSLQSVPLSRVLQASFQHLSLHGCHRHALRIDGIETAHRITQHR